MKFLTRLLALIYVTFVLSIGVVVILFVLQKLDFEYVVRMLDMVYNDIVMRRVFGGIGGFLLFVNFVVYGIFAAERYQDKMIAFDNPTGRVKVSLMALEDLIRRRVTGLSEVKEAKVMIRATGKSIKAKVSLGLRSDVNIPDVTARIQDIVKSKIQDTVGLEEPVTVAVYVGRIVSEKVKETSSEAPRSPDATSREFPFRGYRA